MSQMPKLVDLVQDGMLVTAQGLMRRGATRSRVNNWLRSGELVMAAHGVYRRPGPPLKWQAVVYSLQCMEEYGAILIGGMTALELYGHAHNLALSGKQAVHLYLKDRVPAWLTKVETNATFVLHPLSLFASSKGIVSAEWNADKGMTRYNDPALGFQSVPWGSWDWPLTLSSRERAILEVLEEVPETVSFETADFLMQGLTTLSPNRLEKLLKDCSSIKVKRLFFWLAERHTHTWLKRLADPYGFGLGEGKRMLVKGGTLDKKYLITVPKQLHG